MYWASCKPPPLFYRFHAIWDRKWCYKLLVTVRTDRACVIGDRATITRTCNVKLLTKHLYRTLLETHHVWASGTQPFTSDTMRTYPPICSNCFSIKLRSYCWSGAPGWIAKWKGYNSCSNESWVNQQTRTGWFGNHRGRKLRLPQVGSTSELFTSFTNR